MQIQKESTLCFHEENGFLISEPTHEGELGLRITWKEFRESFCPLESVILKLHEFNNVEDLTFQGRLVIQVEKGFSNAEKVNLVALKGLSIEAASITNKGLLGSKEKPLILTASSIDNEDGQIVSDNLIHILSNDEIEAFGFNNSNGLIVGDTGIYICQSQFKTIGQSKIYSSNGPIQIFTQRDLEYTGLIEAKENICLKSKSGLISSQKATLLTPKDILIRSKKSSSKGIYDEGSTWLANAIDLKTKNSFSLLEKTTSHGGLKISSGGHAVLKDFTLQGNLWVKAKGSINLENSTLNGGADLFGLEMVRMQVVNIASPNKAVTAVSQGPIGFLKTHIRNAKSIEMAGSESQLLETTLESIDSMKVDAAEHTWQNVRMAVTEGGLDVTKGQLELTDVKVFTQGPQKISTEVIDLDEVKLKSIEDSVDLITKIFRATQAEIESAKKTRVKAKKIFTEALSITSQTTIKTRAIKEAKLFYAKLHSKDHVKVKSQKSSIDLTNADVSAKDQLIEAAFDVSMEEAKFWIGRKAKVFAKAGGIKGAKGKIHTTDPMLAQDSSIILGAPEGRINLDDHTMNADQKVFLISKFFQGERSVLKSKGGIDFQIGRIRAKDSQFSSENNDIYLKGSKSIILDNVSKTAAGAISEVSDAWVLVKRETNKASKITREAKSIEISHSNDSAEDIDNKGTATLNLTKYTAKAENHVKITSEGSLSSKESKLTAPDVEMKADALWQKADDLHFNNLNLQARHQQLENSKLKGQGSTFEIGESAFISKNQFEILKNQIRSHTLIYKDNSEDGSFVSQTEGDQIILRNRFKGGDLQFDSTSGELLMNRNTMDVKEAILEAKKISSRRDEFQAEHISAASQEIALTSTNMLSKKDILLSGQEILALCLSHLTSKQIVRLSSASTSIEATHLTGKEAVEFQGDLADLRQVHIKSQKGNIGLSLEQARLGEATIKGVSTKLEGDSFSLQETSIETREFKQEVEHFTGVGLAVTAEKIEREGKDLYLIKSRDSAREIKETIDSAIKHETLTRAETIESKIADLTLYKSTLEAHSLSLENESLKGSENALRSEEMTLEADQVKLRKSELTSERATLKIEQKAELPGNTFTGAFKIEGDLTDLNLASTAIAGAFTVDTQANIEAPHLRVTEEALALKGKSLYLPDLQAEVKKTINLQGAETTYLPDSHLAVTEGSLSITSKNIIAERTEAETKETIYLKGEQDIALEKADLAAEHTIAYEANAFIDHRKAVTKAPITLVTVSFMDNSAGHFKGNVSFEIPFYLENSQATLELGAGQSQIRTGHLNNSPESLIVGPGSLQIRSAMPFVETSQVNIGGTYQAKAPKVTIDTDLSADKAHLYGKKGDVVIEKDRTIVLEREGLIDCESLHNLGRIISQESLILHQENYQDPGDVAGHTLLVLSSSSNMIITSPIDTRGALTLVSKQQVKVDEEIKTGGAFSIGGSQIDLCKKVEAQGKAALQSRGAINFNKIKAIFRKGLASQSESFNLFQSDVEIFAGAEEDSIISCDTFLVKSAVIHGGNSPYAYKHTPSNFVHRGNLILNVLKKALNQGSNVMIDGNLKLSGKDFENLNDMHLFYWIEEAGSYTKRGCCGLGRKKRKTIYVLRSRWIIDGLANTEVRNTFWMDLLGIIRNNGSILADIIKIVRAKSLFNGIFSKIGETPRTLPQNLPHFEELPALIPGGQFQSNTLIEGHFTDTVHTNGTLASRDISLWMERFLAEARVITELTQAAYYRRYGRVSVRWIETERVQPGGEVRADNLNLHMGAGGGTVRGGELTVGRLFAEGGPFSLEAIPVKTITHLEVGRVSPFKRGAGYAEKTVFYKAKAIIDEAIFRLNAPFRNIASDLFARSLDVEANQIEFLTLAAPFIHTRKLGWTRSKTLRSIEMAEPETMALEHYRLVSRSYILIEGMFGSYNGRPEIEAETDIHLRSRSFEAENHTSGFRISGIGVALPKDRFNTVRTTRPQAIGGNGISFKSRNNFRADAPIFHILGGDAIVQSPVVKFLAHQEHHYHHTKTFSLGLSMFGSNALIAAAQGKKGGEVLKSLVSDVPTLNSLLALIGSRDGVSVAMNLTTTTVNLWNTYQDFLSGKSIGQQVGLFDDKGRFNPRITLEAGLSRQRRHWTVTHVPEIYVKDGTFKIISENQELQAVQGYVKKAHLIGHDILLYSAVDTYRERNQRVSGNVSFGGGSGLDFGADFSRSRANQTSHIPFNMYAEEDFIIENTGRLGLFGAQIDAGFVNIESGTVHGKSMQDTFSQSHMNVGGSTSGRVSLGGGGHKEAVVKNGKTFFRSRNRQGRISASRVILEGAGTDNILIDTQDFRPSQIYDVRRGHSFGINLSLGSLFNSETQRRGLTILGELDYHAMNQEGLTRATVSRGNGAELGVNTNVAEMQTMGRAHNTHLGVVLVGFDAPALQNEWQSATQFFEPPVPQEPEIQVREEPLTSNGIRPAEISEEAAASQEEFPEEEFVPVPERKPELFSERAAEILLSANEPSQDDLEAALFNAFMAPHSSSLERAHEQLLSAIDPTHNNLEASFISKRASETNPQERNLEVAIFKAIMAHNPFTKDWNTKKSNSKDLVINKSDDLVQIVSKQMINSLRHYAKNKIDTQMRVIRGSAMILEGFEFVLKVSAKGLYQDLKHMGRDINCLLEASHLKPYTDKIAHYVAMTTKQLLNATGITPASSYLYNKQLKPFYQKTLRPSYRSVKKQYIAFTKTAGQALERSLDIPSAQTEQCFHDSLHIVAAVAPIPFASKIAKVVKMPFSKAKVTPPLSMAARTTLRPKRIVESAPVYTIKAKVRLEAPKTSKAVTIPKPPKILEKRSVHPNEVGLSPKTLKNPDYSHKATMTRSAETLSVKLDWINLPKGTFSLPHYVNNLKNMAKKYGVKKLEFEALFVNPKFCQRWKNAYGQHLTERFSIRSLSRASSKPSEYCKFTFPIEERPLLNAPSVITSTKPAIEQIHNFTLPDTHITNRINRIAGGHFYFPNLAEIQHLPLEELHTLWTRNTETLIGLIAQERIPLFGLHGTGKKGFLGIPESKVSYSVGKDSLFTASYRYELDPITKLSDFYAMIAKSAEYEKVGGGTFVIRTDNALSHEKPIYFSESEKILIQDSLKQVEFTSLIGRQSHLVTLYDIKTRGNNLLKTRDILNTDEFLVKFNPENFQSRVKGAIPRDETIYPANLLHKIQFARPYQPYKEIRDAKDILAKRFKKQEKIAQVFEKLNVPVTSEASPWHSYQKMGRELLDNIDEVTTISQEEFIELYKSSFVPRVQSDAHLMPKTAPEPAPAITNSIESETFTEKLRQFANDESGCVEIPQILRPKQTTLSNLNSTTERINQISANSLYFPEMAEISNLSLKELHKIWARNQETLVGLIAAQNIPRFGLHGTNKLGLEGILQTRSADSFAGDFLWVASYRHRIHPISELADLQNMVKKSSDYTCGKGGFFVVDVSNAIAYGQGFKHNPLLTMLDKAPHKRVFKLMERDGSGTLLIPKRKGQAAINEASIVNVDEFHLHVSKENFAEIVKGIILQKESFYKTGDVVLLAEKDFLEKGILLDRFKTQEIIASAFDSLKIFENLSPPAWGAFQKIGRKILVLPKKETRVPLQNYIEMDQSFAFRNEANKKFIRYNNDFEEKITPPTTKYKEKPLKEWQNLEEKRDVSKIPRRPIKKLDFGNLKNLKCKGYVTLHDNELFIELQKISSKNGVIEPSKLLNEFIHLGKKYKASKLYIEAKLEVDCEFSKFLEKYPVILQRDTLNKSIRPTQNDLHYVYELPLSKQAIKKPSSISCKIKSETFTEKLLAFAKDESGAVPIKIRGKKVSASDFPALRINEAAVGAIYFPTLKEMKSLSLKELHSVWAKNQETLLGLIATENIPRFGLHGTGSKGFKGLTSEKTSKSVDGNFIWVASYRHDLNPMARLADLYNIADRASNYVRKNGGCFFILDVKKALSIEESFIAYDASLMTLDSAAQKRIVKLMSRDGDHTSFLTLTKDGKTAVNEASLLNTDQFFLAINPKNYSEIVKGIFLDKDSLYSKIKLEHFTEANAEKGILAQRIKLQETLLNAFEALNASAKPSSIDWKAYRNLGKKLLNQPKSHSQIPFEEFIKMEQDFAFRNELNKLSIKYRGKSEVVFGKTTKFKGKLIDLDKFAQLPEILKGKNIAEISRRKIKSVDFGKLNLHCQGHVSQFGKQMYIELEGLRSKKLYESIDSFGFIQKLKKFAKTNQAEKLFIELDLKSPNDFVAFIERYPIAFKRQSYTRFGDMNDVRYVYEIPLFNSAAKKTSSISCKIESDTFTEKLLAFAKDESGPVKIPFKNKTSAGEVFTPKSKAVRIQDKIRKLEKFKGILYPKSKQKMIRAHQSIGYEIIEGEGKGSHIKLAKEDFPTIIVPDFHEAPITYKMIWKRFQKLLGKEITLQQKLLQELPISEANLLEEVFIAPRINSGEFLELPVSKKEIFELNTLERVIKQEVAQFNKGIYELIRHSKYKVLDIDIKKSFAEMEPLIPDLTHHYASKEIAWADSILKGSNIVNKVELRPGLYEIELMNGIHYWVREGTTTKVIHQSLGHELFNSTTDASFFTPEIEALGKYGNSSFLITQAFSKPTISELLKQGFDPKLSKVIHQLGKLTAKRHTIPIRDPFILPGEIHATPTFKLINELNKKLIEFELPTIKVSKEYLRELELQHKAVKRTHGLSSLHSLDDLIPLEDAFIFNGFETLTKVYSHAKKPLCIPEKEYHFHLALIEKEALSSGMSVNQAAKLKNAYKAGYGAVVENAAFKYYEIRNRLKIISKLSEEGIESGSVDLSLLGTLIENLNAI